MGMKMEAENRNMEHLFIIFRVKGHMYMGYKLARLPCSSWNSSCYYA